MMAKPSDFFLGVTDLFSVLLPGAAFTFILLRFVESNPSLRRTAANLGLLAWSGDAPKYVAFLVAAYLVGHGLDMVGAFVLDSVYDANYAGPKRAKQKAAEVTRQVALGHSAQAEAAAKRSGDALLDCANSIAGPVLPPNDRLFQWCRAWLLLNNPGAFLEVERVQANSKFFRGMVSAFAGTAAIMALALSWRGVLGAAGCLLLALGSFFRYCDLRWKAVQQTYRLFIAMHLDGAEGGTVRTEAEEA